MRPPAPQSCPLLPDPLQSPYRGSSQGVEVGLQRLTRHSSPSRPRPPLQALRMETADFLHHGRLKPSPIIYAPTYPILCLPICSTSPRIGRSRQPPTPVALRPPAVGQPRGRDSAFPGSPSPCPPSPRPPLSGLRSKPGDGTPTPPVLYAWPGHHVEISIYSVFVWERSRCKTPAGLRDSSRKISTLFLASLPERTYSWPSQDAPKPHPQNAITNASRIF